MNGRSHPGSDLDIALRNPAGGPVDPGALRRLTAALEDSDIPILVEIRDWHRLPEWLREDIRNRPVDLRP